jgi:uncharacterized protein
MRPVFLKAEWRKLILVNYIINPELLAPYLPPHTKIDLFNGNCYVSIVGFMFLNTKIKGIKFPFHINFEEINLRFYVTYNDNGQVKRGAVFISEIVPKPAISIIANALYYEKYQTLPTKHHWKQGAETLDTMYAFKKENKWQSIHVMSSDKKQPILAGSEEEFITEHYWGYTKVNAFKTKEYGVEHDRWETYQILSYEINLDFQNVYGSTFSSLTRQKPESVMLAEGSEIIIRSGKTLTE